MKSLLIPHHVLIYFTLSFPLLNASSFIHFGRYLAHLCLLVLAIHTFSYLALDRLPVSSLPSSMQRHVFNKAARNAQALRPIASIAVASRRAFSISPSSTSQLNSLHTFTDEEEMLRESGTLLLTRSGLTCDRVE
jgi:hypothetical protein